MSRERTEIGKSGVGERERETEFSILYSILSKFKHLYKYFFQKYASPGQKNKVPV